MPVKTTSTKTFSENGIIKPTKRKQEESENLIE